MIAFDTDLHTICTLFVPQFCKTLTINTDYFLYWKVEDGHTFPANSVVHIFVMNENALYPKETTHKKDTTKTGSFPRHRL
jgi:hypothetical protein